MNRWCAMALGVFADINDGGYTVGSSVGSGDAPPPKSCLSFSVLPLDSFFLLLCLLASLLLLLVLPLNLLFRLIFLFC